MNKIPSILSIFLISTLSSIASEIKIDKNLTKSIPSEKNKTMDKNVTSEKNNTIIKTCTSCHGVNFEKSALGKSAIVKGQTAKNIEISLKGYKSGTMNKSGLGPIMKTQTSKLSDTDIREISNLISKIK